MTDEQETMVEKLANEIASLLPDESDFIEKLYDFTYGELSEDQERWLKDIYEKVIG